MVRKKKLQIAQKVQNRKEKSLMLHTLKQLIFILHIKNIYMHYTFIHKSSLLCFLYEWIITTYAIFNAETLLYRQEKLLRSPSVVPWCQVVQQQMERKRVVNHILKICRKI